MQMIDVRDPHAGIISKTQYPLGSMVEAIRWDEKAGLRRDAVRSQVIDVL